MNVASLLNNDRKKNATPGQRKNKINDILCSNGDTSALSSRRASQQSTSSSLATPQPRPLELKQELPKPRRYSEPPIWAQSCKRSLKKSRPSPPVPATTQSASAGPGGVPSLLELPASLAGIVPADDVSTCICNWLYSNLHKLEEDRHFVEVEFKLGVACDKRTNQRVRLPVVSESVMASDYVHDSVFFEANVGDQMFSRSELLIKSFLASGALTHTGDTRTRDDIYAAPNGANIRITFDENDKVVAQITKKRVSDLIIFSPNNLIDLRISLSLEKPYNEDISGLRNPTMIRRKNRQSYDTSGLTVDITSVMREVKSPSKEIELELDGKMLVTFFDNFRAKSDPLAMDKFQELVRFGLDNCRLITRKISQDV